MQSGCRVSRPVVPLTGSPDCSGHWWFAVRLSGSHGPVGGGCRLDRRRVQLSVGAPHGEPWWWSRRYDARMSKFTDEQVEVFVSSFGKIAKNVDMFADLLERGVSANKRQYERMSSAVDDIETALDQLRENVGLALVALPCADRRARCADARSHVALVDARVLTEHLEQHSQGYLASESDRRHALTISAHVIRKQDTPTTMLIQLRCVPECGAHAPKTAHVHRGCLTAPACRRSRRSWHGRRSPDSRSTH